VTCYYAERESVLQIGYRESATMLARGGPAPKGSPIPMSVGDKRMVKPESVTTPSKYGVPYSARYMGGCSWSSQEMFSHVKTRGWHGVEVI
jgi:hypothetical protein